MAERFDPYRKWLGIRPDEQPPDHYRLLGIVRFEDDADTISNAADRQMAHVRTFQTGPHSTLSQSLLNEIAAARVCLLDAVKKGEYDRQLRAKESHRAQPTTTLPTIPTPIVIAPVGRRSPPRIHLRKPAREPSEAYKTLLIAAGLATVAIVALVVYKTHRGENSKVAHDAVFSANQLVEDSTDKARDISDARTGSQSKTVVTGTVITGDEDSTSDGHRPPDDPSSTPQARPPVRVESSSGPASIWEKLTRQLNDFDSWNVASGDWSKKDGRLYGLGDSRLTFQEELPDAFLLSFEMTVVDGLRPRIFFGQKFHFGNEGYDRTLFVHDDIKLPIVGAPRAYSTGIPLKIACRLTEQDVEFVIDGKPVAHCGWERSGPLKLTLSAGDWWSKGQVLFGPFTLGPAPSETLAALPPKKESGSSDQPMPNPANLQAAAKDGAWRDLFDGKSLAGWTRDVGSMNVQNGVLVNQGKRCIVVAPGNYRDFELELEFRLANGGNSGLGICYSGSGDPSQNGLEIQMLDDVANRAIQDIQRSGAVYGVAGAKPGHFKRWPAWNRLRVTSMGDKVSVELNGTLVTDTTRSLMKQANPQHPSVSRTSGQVCLFPIQGRSEYRHIRIQDK